MVTCVGRVALVAGLAGILLMWATCEADAQVELPVGGDVKTAHLISSVPPAYPTLARQQHIEGQVR